MAQENLKVCRYNRKVLWGYPSLRQPTVGKRPELLLPASAWLLLTCLKDVSDLSQEGKAKYGANWHLDTFWPPWGEMEHTCVQIDTLLNLSHAAVLVTNGDWFLYLSKV